MTPGRAEKSDFTRLLAHVQRRTEPRLLRALARSRREAGRLGPEVAELVEAVHSLSIRGGKRLRPALLWVGARAVPLPARRRATTTPDDAVLLEFGVALELLQAYFLIHDDWMDQDDERRGGPTAHVALSRVFGSSEQGARSAILAGDLALALAQRQLAQLDVPADRLVRSLGHFAEMQVAAVYGQQLDVIGHTADAELTYTLKTASYTVLGPLRIGASLAGASEATQAALARYATPAGIAFQLRDDLIGVFGDPAETGKPRGGDLRAGKRTWLLAEALRRAAPRQRKILQRVVGRAEARSGELDEALEVLERSGARAATEARIAEHRARAVRALRATTLSEEGRRLLTGALTALTERDV